MLSSTGCIVADPPQYEEPKRTPPILDLNHAEPSPFWVIVIDRNDNLEPDALNVTVPFRSDDQGEKVWFALHVDFKGDDCGTLATGLGVGFENVCGVILSIGPMSFE